MTVIDYNKLVQILRSAEASGLPKEKCSAANRFRGFIRSRRNDDSDTICDIPMFTAKELREGAEIVRREYIVAADCSFENCLRRIDRAQAAALFLHVLNGETIHFYRSSADLDDVARGVYLALNCCRWKGYAVPNLHKSADLTRLLVDIGFITKEDDGFRLSWRDIIH